MWVETATTLEEANTRISELTQVFPADYFIFDRENALFIIPFNRPETLTEFVPSPGQD